MYISYEIRNFNIFRKSNSEKILLHSKSKSHNFKVLYIYEYIIYINNFSSDNGDFWDMGGGSNDLQRMLNEFDLKDWFDLKNDILNWNRLEREILIESVAFGFDGMFSPSLDKKMIANAGDFLIDMFLVWDDIDNRTEIVEKGFFIKMSQTKRKSDLVFIKEWMLKNGYEKELWRNRIEPFEQAIEQASR